MCLRVFMWKMGVFILFFLISYIDAEFNLEWC